jgi:hypothetical protein
MSGPGLTPYRFGEPISVHDGEIHVATVERVTVRQGGSEVHLEHFAATPFVIRERRRVRKLVLVEATAFIAEQYPAVLTISFSLNKLIQGQNDGMKLAGTRAALLHGMGADQIKIIPNYESAAAGHFVVDGVWQRSPQNLQALAASLHREREAYAAHNDRGRFAKLGDRVRGWLIGIEE